MRNTIVNDLPRNPSHIVHDDLNQPYRRPGLVAHTAVWLAYTDYGALVIRLAIAFGAAWLFAAGDLVSFGLLAFALCVASLALRWEK